jgi:hypothetical protein
MLALGCEGEDTATFRDYPQRGEYVEKYCAYGAVSEAQLQGCLDHVDPAEIDVLDTNASAYADGDLDACLEDSGPFCE